MAQKKPAYEAPRARRRQEKALETALHQIEKNYGKGAVMRLGDRPEMNVDAIPTGSLALDAALGIGGLPRGRIVEIYGPDPPVRRRLPCTFLAEAQKRGGEVAFVDAEHALRSRLCGRHRRRHRLHARFPAGHRRTGSRYHRRPRPLRCH